MSVCAVNIDVTIANGCATATGGTTIHRVDVTTQQGVAAGNETTGGSPHTAALTNGVDATTNTPVTEETGTGPAVVVAGSGATDDNGFYVIHNNSYPAACSNTVSLKSISVKKPQNVTGIEMRSCGNVPKKGDINNYLSSAILKHY